MIAVINDDEYLEYEVGDDDNSFSDWTCFSDRLYKRYNYTFSIWMYNIKLDNLNQCSSILFWILWNCKTVDRGLFYENVLGFILVFGFWGFSNRFLVFQHNKERRRSNQRRRSVNETVEWNFWNSWHFEISWSWWYFKISPKFKILNFGIYFNLTIIVSYNGNCIL